VAVRIREGFRRGKLKDVLVRQGGCRAGRGLGLHGLPRLPMSNENRRVMRVAPLRDWARAVEHFSVCTGLARGAIETYSRRKTPGCAGWRGL